MFTPLHIKNCLKSTSEIEVATTKIQWCRVPHLSSETEVSINCLSLSAMFDSLHSSTNQELFEKHLCNKSSHYEKYRRFLVMQRKPSRATTKLTPFTISKDEWNTKEDTGQSLKNALDILRYAKRHLLC